MDSSKLMVFYFDVYLLYFCYENQKFHVDTPWEVRYMAPLVNLDSLHSLSSLQTWPAPNGSPTQLVVGRPTWKIGLLRTFINPANTLRKQEDRNSVPGVLLSNYCPWKIWKDFLMCYPLLKSEAPGQLIIDKKMDMEAYR